MQATPRRQDRPGTVGFDRAAFERPFDAAMFGGDEQVAGDQAADEAIVARRCELAAPAREAEIGQQESAGTGQRDRAGVTQPGIVVLDLHEADPARVRAGALEDLRGSVAALAHRRRRSRLAETARRLRRAFRRSLRPARGVAPSRSARAATPTARPPAAPIPQAGGIAGNSSRRRSVLRADLVRRGVIHHGVDHAIAFEVDDVIGVGPAIDRRMPARVAARR